MKRVVAGSFALGTYLVTRRQERPADHLIVLIVHVLVKESLRSRLYQLVSCLYCSTREKSC